MRIALLALVATLSATPAMACQFVHEPEPLGASSAEFIARRMTAAAATVDIAVAEHVTPLSRFPTTGIIFKVTERLKGASEERFTLYGAGDGVTVSPPPPLTYWVHTESGTAYPSPPLVEGPDGRGYFPMTSCHPGLIEPVKGASYLIFRDAKGRLLGEVEWSRGLSSHGYSFVQVDNALWLGAVRTVLARP